MIEEFSWELFEKTGSIEAYILSKSVDKTNINKSKNKTKNENDGDVVYCPIKR